jgi:hypothetical protein
VVKPDVYGYDARVQSALKGRYLVVKERSQRGSSVARAARASRSAERRANRARVVERPDDQRYYERRNAYGFFWGWPQRY